MKKFFTVLPIFIFLIFSLEAQNSSDFSDFLETGKFASISDKLSTDVEVSVLEKESVNRKQAELFLKEFFFNNKNCTYKSIHRGSVDNGYYLIGELYANNNLYRTYLYSKQIGTEFIVKEFRIEKQ